MIRKKIILLLLLFSVGAVNAVAQINDFWKVSSTEGKFTGLPENNVAFGRSVAQVGDVNGDGISDVIVGASEYSDLKCSKCGSLWVLLMKENGKVGEQQIISSIDGGFRGPLRNNDGFGFSVVGIGDLDGDGVPDVVSGANKSDDGATDAGAVYVLFLNPDGTVKAEQRISASEGEFRGRLEGKVNFGQSVTFLGDLNSDGRPEIAVGAPGDSGGTRSKGLGAIWIISLNSNGTVFNQQKIGFSTGGFSGRLIDKNQFGYSLSQIGDINGDGVTDLVAGARGNSDIEGDTKGAVWVLLLNPDGTVLDNLKINEMSQGFSGRLNNTDYFGTSLATTGDLDGDGVWELAVGSVGDDDGGTNRGAIWILFLKSDGTVKSHQKINDVLGGFEGTLNNADNFGISLSNTFISAGNPAAGLIVGATGDDDGGIDQGAVWMLELDAEGRVLDEQKVSSTEGRLFGTLSNLDQFGSAIESAGDIDGDGIEEIIVGTNGNDDGGVDRGAIWTLFMNRNGSVDRYLKISATSGGFDGELANGDQFGSSLAKIGDIDGDGISDLAVGAPRDKEGFVEATQGIGAVWILFMNADGTVKGSQKINSVRGGFLGELEDGDQFGNSLTGIGDWNQDGVPDIATGAGGDDDGGKAGNQSNRGAVWMLFLKSDGTVKDHVKINSLEPLLDGLIDDTDRFGNALTLLEDKDGDGINELAVGAYFDEDSGIFQGAIWILFMNRDGSIKRHQKINDSEGGFTGGIDDKDRFGISLATIGDLDKDGIEDLVVGANQDDDGVRNAGAVWILLMNGDGTVKRHQKISSSRGSSIQLRENDWFGISVASIGDINADDVDELVVGAMRDDDGGTDRGAMWIISPQINQPPQLVNKTEKKLYVTLSGREEQINLNDIFVDPEDELLTFRVSGIEDRSKIVAYVSADSMLTVSGNLPELGDSVKVDVIAEDVIGAIDSTSFMTIVDKEPQIGFVIKDQNEPENGSSLTLSTAVEDNGLFPDVKIFYRKGGEERFKDDTMSLSLGNTYSYSFFDTTVTDRGIEYFIVAKDDVGLITRNPATGTNFIAVKVSGVGLEKPSPQPHGETEESYRFISVPLDLESKSPGAVLIDDLGIYDKANWRLYEFRNSMAFEYPNVSDMAPGKAFMLIVKDPNKTIRTGSGSSVSATEAYPVILRPGWNFIGNPFNYPISALNLRFQSTGENVDQFLRYDGNWLFEDGTSSYMINPFEGYGVFNPLSEDDILSIDPTVSSAESSKTGKSAASHSVKSKIEWSISIDAERFDSKKGNVELGVSSSADLGLDRLDKPAPPLFGNYLSLHVSHVDWNYPTYRIGRDMRPPVSDLEEWDLSLDSKLAGIVELDFKGVDQVPEELDVWLIDEAINSVQNVRLQSRIRIVVETTTPRRLKLLVGSSDNVADILYKNQEAIDTYELYQNFPNPFSSATTIHYDLRDQGRISIDVFNILGQKITSLINNRDMPKGRHSVVWDGRSDSGVETPSGVYFVQLITENTRLTKRMVLISN